MLESGAHLSPCRQYRYRLWRDWDPGAGRCVFVGLNPSTADEHTDDPTIRKCVGFAKRWGFGAIDMVNLFAYRSTSPKGLLTQECPSCAGVGRPMSYVLHGQTWTCGRCKYSSPVDRPRKGGDPVGPANDEAIARVFGDAKRIVLAWGEHGPRIRRLVEARLKDPGWVALPRPCERGTLGYAKTGAPRHPLMLAYVTPFELTAASP